METRFAFNNSLHKWTKLSDLFKVRAMVLLRELITNPKNVSSCVGIKTDCTGCIVNPKLSKSDTVSFILSLHEL